MEDEVGLGVWIIGFLFFGALIAGVIFIAKFFDIDFFGGNEIKAYSASCKTRVDELGFCDNPLLPLSVTTYKVSYNSQRVISDNGGLVNKYTDCTVKDRKNWTCSFDDKSGDFGFASGTFFSIPNWDKVKSRHLLEKTYYPDKFEYIDLRIKAGGGCKGYYPICYFLTVMTLI